MKNKSRANALLIELLIVIIFFMFVSVTLVEVFSASRTKSISSQSISRAMLDAQKIAEGLYGAEQTEDALQEMGFSLDGEEWILNRDGYVLSVSELEDEHTGGVLRTLTVTAKEKDRVLVTLPSVRYIPKEVAP